MSSVSIEQVNTKNQIKKFCNFPLHLYKNTPYWVPQIISDEEKSMQKEHNPAFDYCKAAFWIAYKDKKIVGRIGAIVNKKYNELRNVKMGRFTRLEFIDDIKVSKLLLDTAIAWLKKNEMVQVQGPLGFSNLDQQGMLIEGFEELSAMGSCYHHKYYKNHLKELGFEKEIDWLEYKITIEEKLSEKIPKLTKLLKERYNLKVINFSTTKELLERSDEVLNLLSETYKDLHGMTPLTNKVKEFYKKKFISYLNPELIKIVENEKNEIISFVIITRSLAEGLKKGKGKIFPFGWYHLLQSSKKSERGEMLLGAVREDFQNKGVTGLMMAAAHSAVLKANIKSVESTAMLENNTAVINSLKHFDIRQHKRKRCWKKMI